MSRRRDPIRISDVLPEITGGLQPQTGIARVQSAWPKAAGATRGRRDLRVHRFDGRARARDDEAGAAEKARGNASGGAPERAEIRDPVTKFTYLQNSA
jgi:hypothetical protein